MRVFLTLIVLLALSVGSVAGEIRKGATMRVKANSIWFQDTDRLTHWQALKKSGDSTALSSYQEEVLGNWDAWQFINPLTVKILSYKPRENRVDVEMKTSGRLLGTTWSLDADALMQ